MQELVQNCSETIPKKLRKYKWKVLENGEKIIKNEKDDLSMLLNASYIENKVILVTILRCIILDKQNLEK